MALPSDPGQTSLGVPSEDADAARWRRVLATMFDALVRIVRTGGPVVKQSATRLLEHWRTRPDTPLGLRPTALEVEGTVVLTAGDREGKWILPAFMTGLRTIRPRPEATPEDLQRLAVELAGVTSTSASLNTLRDWLWTDGADGIDVMLAQSFVEAMEATQAEVDPTRLRGAAVRERVGSGAPEAMRVDARVLDAAVLRAEYDVPLMSYAKESVSGRFQLPDDEVRRLKRDVEEPVTWATCELEVVLRRPDFRASVPADRLLKRLTALLQRRGDGETIKLIVEMGSHQDAWSRTFMRAVHDEDVGETIARAARVDDPGVSEAVVALCAAGDADLARPVLRGLLARSDTDALLVAAVGTLPAARLLSLADAATLLPDQAGALVRALLAASAPPQVLESLAATLPELAMPTAMTLLPETVIAKLQDKLKQMLTASAPGGVAQALRMVTARGRSSAWQIVADALQADRGKGWSDDELRDACGQLATKGYARRFLLVWIRDRATPSPLRLASLDAIAPQLDVLAEALAFRATELFDPPEVKAKLKELRAVIKGAAE